MKINSDEIKQHIKKHYSGSVNWRVGFRNKKKDSLKSKIINYLKAKQLQTFLKSLKNLNNKKILDAGCGNGEYSLALAKKFPKAIIYAVDFSEAMCKLTKKRAEAHNLKNIKTINGDIDNLPFDDNYFDVVFCIDTLHHIPTQTIRKTLNELKRLLCGRGKLIIDFKNKFNPYVYYSHKKAESVTYYCTNRSLKEMQCLLGNHFKISKVRGVGFPLRFIAPYVIIFGEKK